MSSTDLAALIEPAPRRHSITAPRPNFEDEFGKASAAATPQLSRSSSIKSLRRKRSRHNSSLFPVDEATASQIRRSPLPPLPKLGRSKSTNHANYLSQALTLAEPLPVRSSTGRTVVIFRTDIPGYSKMPHAEQLTSHQIIADKVEAGRALFRILKKTKLSDLETLPRPTRENLSDILFYLKTTAEVIADDPYERGAFTIPDHENKIRLYFDRALDTTPRDGDLTQTIGKADPAPKTDSPLYTRRSTHLPVVQKTFPKKADAPSAPSEAEQARYFLDHQPRGCDFYEGVNDDKTIASYRMLLPCGMCTLLYQQCETPAGEDRLFIKMERESARADPGKKNYPGQFESRPLVTEDALRAVKHVKNLVQHKIAGNQAENKELTTFHEVASKEVFAKFKGIKKAAKPYPELVEVLINAKLPNSEKFNIHLGQMTINVSRFVEAMRRTAASSDPAIRRALIAFESAVEDMNLCGSQNPADHFGDEVALTNDHLTASDSDGEEFLATTQTLAASTSRLQRFRLNVETE